MPQLSVEQSMFFFPVALKPKFDLPLFSFPPSSFTHTHARAHTHTTRTKTTKQSLSRTRTCRFSSVPTNRRAAWLPQVFADFGVDINEEMLPTLWLHDKYGLVCKYHPEKVALPNHQLCCAILGVQYGARICRLHCNGHNESGNITTASNQKQHPSAPLFAHVLLLLPSLSLFPFSLLLLTL